MNLFQFLAEMASDYFELTEEQEQLFETKATELFECAESLDVPLVIMATLANIDRDDHVQLKTAVMSHIDVRRCNPMMSVIAAMLDREGEPQQKPVPGYVKMLGAAVVLAMKEKGPAEALELMLALRPTVEPFMKQLFGSSEGEDEEEDEEEDDFDHPLRRENFPEMSDAAYESFSNLIESLKVSFDDLDEDD